MKTRLVAAAFGLILVSFGGIRPVGVEAHIRTTANRSVGLIHGVYHLQRPDGSVTPDSEYTGSGFMIRGRWVASCRHVLAPWNDVPYQRGLVEKGAVGVFTELTVTFPGLMPVKLDPKTIRHGVSRDVAVAKALGDLSSVPALDVREDGSEGSGVAAYVMGYPLGLGPLRYRSPDAVSAGFPFGAGMAAQIRYLAKHGAVVPLFFKGVINSSQRHLITTDAAMTFGCSGGPVLGDDGKVIGVNFATIRGFDGMNMVVPIRHVLALIDG